VTALPGRLGQDPAVRLLRLARPAAGRLVLVLAACAGGVLCAVGLAATAAWMLATAAGQPPVLTLAVAVVAVRAFGLGRGVLRYVERLLGHDAAFRVLASIRCLVWTRLEPLVPGGLPSARGGDLLTRVVDDVDAVQDLYLRALAPPVVAVVVGGACTALAAHLLPAAGAVLGLLLCASAVLLPTLVLAAERPAPCGRPRRPAASWRRSSSSRSRGRRSSPRTARSDLRWSGRAPSTSASPSTTGAPRGWPDWPTGCTPR
jgi:ABC-type transport system involved in cytochrome bd biosynthesis fused ATPase/permease subunit